MNKELLVIKILNTGFRTKDIETGELLSLKTGIYLKVAEFDTITFEIEKEWTFKKQKYATGKILGNKLILSNIKTTKIEYMSAGIWDPHETFGDEADEYYSDYIKEGYREEFIFKDYSGFGFYEEESDLVFESAELKNIGEWGKAYDLLTDLWGNYPECIDALVHIGNMYFDNECYLNRLYNCYKVAVDIVERNLPKDFDGMFLWGHLENRPYLRALHGLCLVLWRQKKFEEAFNIAKKLLRICPTDNLGIRFIIDNTKNHEEWTEDI